MSISSRKNCLVSDRMSLKFYLIFLMFSADAIERNQQLEFERNIEKLQIMKVRMNFKEQLLLLFHFLLKWSATAFDRISIIPPGISVCQQINLEYLSKLTILENDKDEQITFVYPDTLIGTDTHTTLSNGFGVLSYSK
jgi:aconitase A